MNNVLVRLGNEKENYIVKLAVQGSSDKEVLMNTVAYVKDKVAFSSGPLDALIQMGNPPSDSKVKGIEVYPKNSSYVKYILDILTSGGKVKINLDTVVVPSHSSSLIKTMNLKSFAGFYDAKAWLAHSFDNLIVDFTTLANKVVKFTYDGGSNPGETKLVKVSSYASSHRLLYGEDLVKEGTRSYSVDKISDLKVLS